MVRDEALLWVSQDVLQDEDRSLQTTDNRVLVNKQQRSRPFVDPQRTNNEKPAENRFSNTNQKALGSGQPQAAPLI